MPADPRMGHSELLLHCFANREPYKAQTGCSPNTVTSPSYCLSEKEIHSNAKPEEIVNTACSKQMNSSLKLLKGSLLSTTCSPNTPPCRKSSGSARSESERVDCNRGSTAVRNQKSRKPDANGLTVHTEHCKQIKLILKLC